MNHKGEYFSGHSQGYFKWSSDYKEARELDNLGQFNTLSKFEPSMELVYEYV